MRTKLAAAAVALLMGLVGLLAPAWTASATTGGSPAHTSAATITPLEGHYSGRDAHGHHIRFNYRDGRVHHFQINHLDIGGAAVADARWSTSCADAYHCSWGEWTSATDVSGAWNSGTHGGSARHFTAHWVRSHAG